MKWPNRLKTFQQQILRIWVKCYVLLYNPPLFLAFMSALSTTKSAYELIEESCWTELNKNWMALWK